MFVYITWPQLLKGRITLIVHWVNSYPADKMCIFIIHWIVIYPADKAIQPLNDWGLVCKSSFQLMVIKAKSKVITLEHQK